MSEVISSGKKLLGIKRKVNEIETWPLNWCINKGSKLRIDISSSNFPAYNNYLNNSGLWSKQKDSIIANQTI